MMKAAVLDRVEEQGQAVAPVPPKSDRLPLQRKINLLSDRGHWPKLEQLARTYGWHSEQMHAFIDENLPKAPCPICDTEFYVYSKRVKYCSDRCRRAAAAGAERSRNGATDAGDVASPMEQRKAPAEKNGDLCVRLERAGDSPQDRRFYILMVVQDLFGSVALVRRWGRDERERSQQTVTTYLTLDQALEDMERHKAVCLKRGYQLVAVERGRIDRRTFA